MTAPQPHPVPPVAPPVRTTSPARWTVVGGVAILVLVAGTFLPWIRSGRATRNSYELAGVGVRRLDAGAAVDAVLQAWPFLGPLWAVVIVLAILGHRRSAAVATAVLAVLAGLVAVGGVALAVRVDSTAISGVLVGPAVTLVGAVVATVAAVAVLRSRPRSADVSLSGPFENIW